MRCTWGDMGYGKPSGWMTWRPGRRWNCQWQGDELGLLIRARIDCRGQARTWIIDRATSLKNGHLRRAITIGWAAPDLTGITHIAPRLGLKDNVRWDDGLSIIQGTRNMR